MAGEGASGDALCMERVQSVPEAVSPLPLGIKPQGKSFQVRMFQIGNGSWMEAEYGREGKLKRTEFLFYGRCRTRQYLIQSPKQCCKVALLPFHR